MFAMLSYIYGSAIAQATQIIVGYLMGARKVEETDRRVNATLRAAMLVSFVISLLLFLLVGLAALLTAATLLFIIGYILVRGAPHITPSLFELTYNSVNVSLFPAVVTTVMMTLLSLLIAAPLGIFTAIYLSNTPAAATGSSGWCGLPPKRSAASPRSSTGSSGCSSSSPRCTGAFRSFRARARWRS